MKKIKLELTIDNIVAAVVPAVEKAFEGKFNAVDARFVKIDAKFDNIDANFDNIDAKFDNIDARFEKIDARFDSLESHMDKKIDSAFNELAAMTSKEFGVVHKEINKLAWRMEMLA